jgi:hypothetical protein
MTPTALLSIRALALIALVAVPLLPFAADPPASKTTAKDVSKKVDDAGRGIAARIQGAGLVVAQSPEPGAPLDLGVSCTLTLDRNPRRLAQALVAEVP